MLNRTVVFVNHSSEVSGAEKAMFAVAALALDQGMDVVVASPTGELSTALPSGCRHMSIPRLGLSGERGVRRLIGVAQLLAGWTVTGVRLRRLARKPGTVLVVNSLFALPAARIASPRGGASWLVHDIVVETKQKVLVRVSKSVVDHAVAVSEPSARALRSLGLRVDVVHLGVRRTEARPRRMPSTPPVVGMMGTVTEWKGHRVLLEAAAQLPDIRVQIAGRPFAGDETYYEELRTRASRSDLTGRVEFLGHVDPMPVLSDWDLLVLPTLRPEPGPTVALEAMSIGVPIVGSNHGGIADALRDDVGFLVEPGNADDLAAGIRTVLSDHDRRNKMSQAGKERTDAEYDIEHTLPSMLAKLVAR